jgi:transcription-repair coupling factor (superfamily II helicase)
MGGKAWQNLKSRARASLRELAGELLALYARRQQAEGQAFDLRNEWLERLETEFPYRETEDQQRPIEAVKEDLEAPPLLGKKQNRRPNTPARGAALQQAQLTQEKQATLKSM